MHPTIEINLKRKAIYGRSAVYLVLALAFFWALLPGPGGSEPGAVLILPISIIWMVVLLIKEIGWLRVQDPFITLDRQGLRCGAVPFNALGAIKWEDITGCADFSIGWNKERYLLIHVANPEMYAAHIEIPGKRRGFMRKRRKYDDAIMWINVAHIDYDLVELKRSIFQRIENFAAPTRSF